MVKYVVIKFNLFINIVFYITVRSMDFFFECSGKFFECFLFIILVIIWKGDCEQVRVLVEQLLGNFKIIQIRNESVCREVVKNQFYCDVFGGKVERICQWWIVRVEIKGKN